MNLSESASESEARLVNKFITPLDRARRARSSNGVLTIATNRAALILALLGNTDT